MKQIVFILYLLSSIQIFATNSNKSVKLETNSSKSKTISTQVTSVEQNLILEKDAIEKELLKNNIWSKIYSNYHTYQELKKKKLLLDGEIIHLKKHKRLSKKNKAKLKEFQNKMTTVEGKLQLLKEYDNDPFKKFLVPPKIASVPVISNPLAIIGALSYKEKLNSDRKEYLNRYNSLKHIVQKLKQKQHILKQLNFIVKNNIKYTKDLQITDEQLKTFMPIMDIFTTTQNVYNKKIDEIELNLKSDIEKEIERTVNILAIILFFVILLFIIKYLVRRYMSDNDRFYAINKALNITFMTFLIFTLLLAYIENVSYLVTILGFASAGIAIAMKDWFMSFMGWITIIMGGAIHVGDRVKFQRGGIEYIGDIVDISMLRMTMHEDVTLTAYMHNRRAGRIIFIPNNFIFTDMIANYSHAGLKTVWDGVDFMITFDSDIQKAASIAKEVTKKYSKGYTDITRKQLNKLRSQYHIKNTNVEPRILTFIEPYGMKISAWYLTNAYATLTLRSTISAEIIKKIQAEEGISLAFPTQSIYVDKNVPKPVENIEDIPNGEEIV